MVGLLKSCNFIESYVFNFRNHSHTYTSSTLGHCFYIVEFDKEIIMKIKHTAKEEYIKIKPKDIEGKYNLNYKKALYWARLGNLLHQLEREKETK